MNYSRGIFRSIAVIMLLTGVSCENEKEVPDPFSQGIPLLEGKNRIGIIRGFNPDNPESTMDSIDLRWEMALNAGMNVGRLQIDWPELQPGEGVYNLDGLREELQEFHENGLQTMLLISVYDSEGPVYPEHLKGKEINDEVLIESFNRLMDKVIPLLTDYGGFAIAIANEPDNSFPEKPDLSSRVLDFLLKVRRHIHGINDKMAVTITLAEGSLNAGVPGLSPIIENSDIACWNFYGGGLNNSPVYYPALSREEIQSDIRAMLDASFDKRLVIQELGMWSGSDALDSSPEIQKEFFDVFFREMEKEKRIIVSFVFQMVDWSEGATELMTKNLEEEGVPADFIAEFEESLMTMGLIRYSDGSAKPAWNSFMEWLEFFN